MEFREYLVAVRWGMAGSPHLLVPVPQVVFMRSRIAEQDRIEGEGWGFLSEVSPAPGPNSGPLSPHHFLQAPAFHLPLLTPPAHFSAASNIDNVVLDEDRSGARRLQNLWR